MVKEQKDLFEKRSEVFRDKIHKPVKIQNLFYLVGQLLQKDQGIQRFQEDQLVLQVQLLQPLQPGLLDPVVRDYQQDQVGQQDLVNQKVLRIL